MKKTVWTFGLLSGGILSLMMLITMPFVESIGYENGEVIGYTTMVLAFLLIFFGVRSYRDNVANGSVSFGRALKVGSLIALIASICYVATWEVIYFKLAPGFQSKFSEMAIAKARAEGGTPAEIEARVAEMERFTELYQNPAINAAITLIEPLPVGLLFALITATAIGRKRDDDAPGPDTVT